MKSLERSCLADEAAARLKEEIACGRMAEELPACRDLAAGLGVSLPTVVAALQQLAAEGVLVAGKSRRPYRLAVGIGQVPLPQRRLLLLNPRSVGGLKTVTRDTQERIHRQCAGEGWEVQSRILDYSSALRPSRRWDELLEKERPTHLVAVMGTPVLARWARGHGVHTLFLGGSPGDTTVPSLGISLSACVRLLLPTLLDQGHRNFCLPVCGYPEVYVEALREVCRQALEARGLAFVPAYHTPVRPQGNGVAVRAALRAVFATRPPTALIFTGVNDYLASLGMLHHYRLIPGTDVSITVLTHEEPLDWMDPRPAHFLLPSVRVSQLVRNWLKTPGAPRFNRGAISLRATYVPGTVSLV